MVQIEQETSLFEALGNTITDTLQGFIERVKPKDKRYAPFLPFADSASVPAQGGFAVLDLKGPTKGRFWYVRKLRISGVTPSTSISNSEWTFSAATDTITITFPNGGTLQSMSFIYTTDATVANRTVVVTVTEANNRTLYQIASPFSQAASLSVEYSLAPNLAATANGNPPSVTMPLPASLTIPPGGHIVITVQNGDPGDTITNGTIIFSGTTRADVFICPDDLRGVPTLAQCPIMSWRDQFTTIPGVTSYGVGELRVGSQEHLWVAVSNGSITAQNVVASCEAYEWPDVDENVEWVL